MPVVSLIIEVQVPNHYNIEPNKAFSLELCPLHEEGDPYYNLGPQVSPNCVHKGIGSLLFPGVAHAPQKINFGEHGPVEHKNEKMGGKKNVIECTIEGVESGPLLDVQEYMH